MTGDLFNSRGPISEKDSLLLIHNYTLVVVMVTALSGRRATQGELQFKGHGIIEVASETGGDCSCCGPRFVSYSRISLCLYRR